MEISHYQMARQLVETEDKLQQDQEKYKELTGGYLSPFASLLEEIQKGVEQVDMNIRA